MSVPEGASSPVAVVTGASQGLGLALAEALARSGWRLVIDARRRDRLEAAAARLSATTTVIAIPGDVADPAHRAMLADAAADLGTVALVVNNASSLGASPLPSVSDIPAAVLHRIFEVNVIAPVALLQALGPSLGPGATAVTALVLSPTNEAHEPPEARGLARDGVRLLVSRGEDEPVDTTFDRIGTFLVPGDLLVVNTTATIPAALDGTLRDGEPVVVHLSGTLPGEVWLVEVRRPDRGATVPLALDAPTAR